MDENKENQTPEGVQQQGELDWVQQYSLDQEREEQELQQALAQSLQEHVRSKARWSVELSLKNGTIVEGAAALKCHETATCITYKG